MTPPPPGLTIIVPCLNEATTIGACIQSVRDRAADPDRIEILVSDCRSRDRTVEEARRQAAHVLCPDPPPASRAEALNLGAQCASAPVLLFLDADSVPPPDFDRLIEACLQDPAVVGGAFEFAMDGAPVALRVIELVNRVRYRIWKLYYGDQGLFVRKESFASAGGFPPLRVMESSDLCRSLRRLGRLRLIRQPMKTSPRRFIEGGIWRVFRHDIWIWWLDLVRLPTAHHGDAYRMNNVARGEAAGPGVREPGLRGRIR